MTLKLLLVLITIIASPSTGQRELVGLSIDTADIPIAKAENGIVEINKGEETDLKSRMERIEAKSQRQEKEIEVLKTQLEEEKKFSERLSGRISQLEALTNPMKNEELLERRKRPYRLLPLLTPPEKENKDEERNKQFYGPATNCDELGLLGYTLNGYYFVQKISDLTKSGKIVMVYCQFQQHQRETKILQKVVGTVDVKTKSVNFYVQRNSSFREENAIIPFELARINEGHAFNLASGIFIAPVKGIYHFQIVGFKDSSSNILFVSLRVNGVSVGITFTRTSDKGGGDLVSLSSSLRLAAGDKVSLLKSHGMLYDDRNHLTHFCGWLVEEEMI